MTPETLAAILHRAGVGTWHNSVGPHHETHLEEARALLREPEFVALVRIRDAAEAAMDVADYWTDETETQPLWDEIPVELADRLVLVRAALQAEPARAEERRTADHPPCGDTTHAHTRSTDRDETALHPYHSEIGSAFCDRCQPARAEEGAS